MPREPRADLDALVFKRHDFRESSRLITVVTRDRGKLTILAKGGHRAGSQCLGRIDFLNHVRLKVSGGSLPILHRVKLLHEPRALREPARYVAASYLAEIFDVALPPERADAALFDLLLGAIRMLERCPEAAIATVLAGVELRFLRELGLQPPLLSCSRCGASLDAGRLFPARHHPGLLCETHAEHREDGVPAAALRWLDRIDEARGRDWPSLPPPPRGVLGLLDRWLAAALERRPRLRGAALARNGAS